MRSLVMDQAHLRQLGMVTAVDCFLENPDRVMSANFGNWFVAAAGAITLIDNLDDRAKGMWRDGPGLGSTTNLQKLAKGALQQTARDAVNQLARGMKNAGDQDVDTWMGQLAHAQAPCIRHDDSAFVVAEIHTVLRLARMCTGGDACSLQRAPYTQCFCFELFRHAIVRRDDLAWEALYTRYAPLVRHWLGAWSGAGAGMDEGDEEIAVVFGRFWQAVDAAKLARFDSLAAVLHYLKLTAHAVRLDRTRTTGARGNWLLSDDALLEASAHEDMAEAVARRVDSPGFWRTVRGVLAGEREELLFHLSYIMDLSPREICARHGAQFPDVGEVYRLKRNALDRLRRAPEMRALLHTS